MWEFLGLVFQSMLSVLDVFGIAREYGAGAEKERGCFWAVVFFLGLCLIVGLIVWLVMRS